MNRCLNRRTFLNVVAATGVGLGLAGLGDSPLWAAESASPAAPHAEKLGWRLGCHAYSFSHFTLFEAIEKTASLGLRYIEAMETQALSKEYPDVVVNENLSAELRKAIKQKLADFGIQMVCYFADNNESPGVFEFAKELGAETLVTAPQGDFETLDARCAEYEINVAIANHAKPTPYWNPDTVLKACQGRSKRIGASADTGHWMRSGLNPAECLKKLEGRIISFHLRDMSQPGMDGHDVPYGAGVCDMKGILAEIHRQGIKAVFSIEYGYDFDDNMPEIAQCIAFFEKTAAELAARG